MTAYRFRVLSAGALFFLLAFLVLAFGGVELWALTIFEVATFALASVWVLRMAFGRVRPVWNIFLLPWAALALWTWCQYAFGWSIHRYRTEEEALKWLALWLLMAIACHVFTDDSIRSRFHLALVWFAFGLCVFGLVQYFTSRNTIYFLIPVPAGKIFGPFIDANHFTVLMELITPSALLLALRPSEQRPIYIVAANLILASVVVCASRAGIALVAMETAIVLAASVLGRRSRRRSRQRRVLLPIAGLAAVAAFFVLVSGSRPLMERFREDQPYSVRWNVARAAWRLFLSRPLTGYGAGTFEEVFPSAAAEDLGVVWQHAHNDPAQFAMEWGLAGAVVLIGSVALLLRRKWPREVWLTLVLPLLTVLIHSWFDFPLQIPALAAAWLMLLAQVEPAARPAGASQARSSGRRSGRVARASDRVLKPVYP